MLNLRRPAVALVLLLTSACGTTVPLTGSQQVDGSGANSGLQAGAGGTSSRPTTSSDLPATALAPGSNLNPGGPLTSPDQRGQTIPSTTGPAAAAPGSLAVKGRGWDASSVYVGIITTSDAATGLQASGISLNPGDEIGDAAAVVADLNRKGGLFGRKIVLIDKDDSSANVLADPTTAGQADCTYFGQDHPVIGVVNTDASLDLDSFRACFKKAQIPLTSITTSAFDDQVTSSLSPFFYNALTVSWSRLISPLVQHLQTQGYFNGWNATTGTSSPTTKPKVGVLYGSDNAGGRVGPSLLSALQQAGYATDSFQYGSTGDASAAELKFAGDGVTHVIGIDSFQFFFMTSARSQHYLPRYGVTSYNGLQALLVSNGDKTQLNGALGIGWYPTLDTEQAQDPGPGPGSRGCLNALRAGGQTFAGKRFAQAVGMAICDGIHLVVLGAKSGGGLTPAAIRQGIIALGTGFPTGGGFASGLNSTNYAMPGAGRDIGWDTNCQCFTYRGPTYRIG